MQSQLKYVSKIVPSMMTYLLYFSKIRMDLSNWNVNGFMK